VQEGKVQRIVDRLNIEFNVIIPRVQYVAEMERNIPDAGLKICLSVEFDEKEVVHVAQVLAKIANEELA